MAELSRKEIEVYLKVYCLTIINWQKKGFLIPIKSKNIITYNVLEVITLAKKRVIKKELQLSKASKGLEKLKTYAKKKIHSRNKIVFKTKCLNKENKRS